MSVEKSRPIYVSAMLTPKEDEEYFKLLSENKDVLALSYKEMPGLNPRVPVHHLSIKKVFHPRSNLNGIFDLS